MVNSTNQRYQRQHSQRSFDHSGDAALFSRPPIASPSKLIFLYVMHPRQACFAPTHAFITSGPSSLYRCKRSIRRRPRVPFLLCSTLSQPVEEYHQETFRVTPSESGVRIDKLLATRFNERSRSYIQSLLTSGNVEISGRTPPKSHRAAAGEVVAIRFLPTQRELPLVPEDIPLEILYEDDYLLCINKPAGMVMHPAPGNWNGTLVHALSYRYLSVREMGGPRPGIVHRLDKGTTGVLVAAKTAEVQADLARMFAERGVMKDYIAITAGNPAGKGCVGCVINEPVGRSPTDRLRMAVLPVDAGGKVAKSVVEVVASDDRGLLHCVQVGIKTGRTHQIRVHMRHARAPVLGDDLYGALDINRRFCTAAQRPMLHARRLRFKHPVTGAEVDISAPLGKDMRSLLERLVYPEFEERWP